MTASSPSSKPSTPIEERVEALVQAAQACRLCPAMDGRRRVLSSANGPVPAQVMLVGEAPGRLGAERTGVPFCGDAAGRRLDLLLAHAGWSRDEIFITNAVLCNPQDAHGNNRSPAVREVSNCIALLERQLVAVSPMLVVALGAIALKALAMLQPHELALRDAGSAPVHWHGRWLAGVYHPGVRAALHRPFAEQQHDFARLGRWLREVNAGNDAVP